MSEKLELIESKKFELLKPMKYNSKAGRAEETSTVILKALKTKDADKIFELLRGGANMQVLTFLIDKRYITPIEDESATLICSEYDARAAFNLNNEYARSFLDFTSFSGIEEEDVNL